MTFTAGTTTTINDHPVLIVSVTKRDAVVRCRNYEAGDWRKNAMRVPLYLLGS